MVRSVLEKNLLDVFNHTLKIEATFKIFFWVCCFDKETSLGTFEKVIVGMKLIYCAAMEVNAGEERVKIKTNSQAELCEVCNKEYIAEDSEIKYMCNVGKMIIINSI